MDNILPKNINNEYKGLAIAKITFVIIVIMSIVRSLIHIFAPDGGASSIAGMDLSAGSKEIIFVFALWGSAQLVQAIIQLVVYLKYKSLIPFMYLIFILEYSLRILVGKIKGVTFSHTPPGAIGNYLIILISILMFILALKKKK